MVAKKPPLPQLRRQTNVLHSAEIHNPDTSPSGENTHRRRANIAKIKKVVLPRCILIQLIALIFSGQPFLILAIAKGKQQQRGVKVKTPQPNMEEQ